MSDHLNHDEQMVVAKNGSSMDNRDVHSPTLNAPPSAAVQRVSPATKTGMIYDPFEPYRFWHISCFTEVDFQDWYLSMYMHLSTPFLAEMEAIWCDTCGGAVGGSCKCDTLALSDCLDFLNSLQIASGGAWLDMQMEMDE